MEKIIHDIEEIALTWKAPGYRKFMVSVSSIDIEFIFSPKKQHLTDEFCCSR